ncbi:MAG: aminoglycoside phosphotransferase family protein [Pseudomonadota bacterium]
MPKPTLMIDSSIRPTDNAKGCVDENGQHSFAGFTQRIERLVELWQLADVVPLTNLSVNFLANAIRDGQRVVLKIGREEKAIHRESSWLTHYGQHTSRVVVPVLERDGHDAYLMPRLDPGISVDRIPDDTATEIIGSCINSLTESSTTIPLEPSYPNLREWFTLLEHTSEASRRKLCKRIDRAYGLFCELVHASESRLLHGDLHHYNLLNDNNCWIVTDPKGVIGDPSHECAAMLRNALGSLHGAVSRGVRRRVDQLASITGFEASRIAAWGYAQNVLSCAWALEEDPYTDVSEVLVVVDALE